MSFKIKDGLRIGTVDVFNSSGVLLVGAPQLITARNINGVSFNGTADITVTVPISTGVTGLGTGVATFLATPTSANLASAVTDETGSGSLVFATSPTLTTPTLGVATATSINKVAITAPATSATLTIADGKTLTASNTLTLTGTDGSSVAFGAGGTVAYTSNKLNVFASTSSSELAGVISDETGSGALVFGTSPAITTSLTTPSTTFALVNTTATTVNFAGAATSLSIGAGTGTTTVNNNLTVTGDLVVNGTTTTVNSTTVSVDDKNIELGSVASPTNTTADGGGITLKGTTDKTLNWVNATGAWTSSEDFNLLTGKVYEINGTSVLSASTLGSGVTASSLTSVGTVTSGTWSASFGAVSGANLTNLTAGNLSGTIPSAVLGNSSLYIGTTSVALNRASANLALTGISSVTLPGSSSGTAQIVPAAAAGTGTVLTLPATSGTIALVTDMPVVNNGTLTLSIGSAGSTNTTVTVGTGTGFSANTSSNSTYSLSVGPAITALATTMTGAGSGFLKKTGADTYTVDTNTYITAETDTLSTVTGRGATTSTDVQLNGASLKFATSGNDKVLKKVITPASIGVNTATVIDSFATSTYRSAKYTIQIVQGIGKYQLSEVRIIHDGTSVYGTEYSVLETNAGSPIPVTFSYAIASGTLSLSATITDAAASSATLIMERTLFVV